MAQGFLSGPAIAALSACSLMAVNKRLRAGRYGPLLHRGPVGYAALDRVERDLGYSIHPDQITRAAAGEPGRILTIPEAAADEEA